MTKTVAMRGVVKRFGATTALDGVSFEVEEGQCVSLLGPSGCGKTTTLRVIAGFEQVDEGQVLINGQDMVGRRPYERSIGLVFQDYALFPHMTVEQNITYGMRHRRVPREKIPGRLKDVLATVNLSGFERRRPLQLSGGEQQRVALARALATRPELMLLDEPMSNLDAKLREQVRGEIKDILTRTGSTTIIVTHDQQEAMSMAETVIVMNAGRVMQRGTPEEIYGRPANRFVADFIGRTNWFRGHLGATAGPGVRRFRSSDGLELLVPEVPGAASDCEVGIRPERITVVRAGDGPAAPEEGFVNRLAGTVTELSHLGAQFHLTVTLDCGRRLLVTEKNAGQSVERERTPVTLCFEASSCMVLPPEGAPAGEGGE